MPTYQELKVRVTQSQTNNILRTLNRQTLNNDHPHFLKETKIRELFFQFIY